MTDRYDLLERLLADVVNGMDVETALRPYPEQAEELRPILQAAVRANQKAVSAPSADVLRRSRARVLQRAAELREAQVHRPFDWSPAVRRLALSLALLMLFFFGGTGFVGAASKALPNDGLYTTKRWLEQTRLAFTLDAAARTELAEAIAKERLNEVRQLFVLDVSAPVEFIGIVTDQRGDAWQVADIPVFVTVQTQFPDGPVQVGMLVHVQGVTRGQLVLAESVEIVTGGDVPAVPSPVVTATPVPSSTLTPVMIGSVTVTLTPTQTATPSLTPTLPAGSGNTNGNTNSGGANDNNTNTNTNDNDNSDSNSNDDDSNNDNSNDDNGNG